MASKKSDPKPVTQAQVDKVVKLEAAAIKKAEANPTPKNIAAAAAAQARVDAVSTNGVPKTGAVSGQGLKAAKQTESQVQKQFQSLNAQQKYELNTMKKEGATKAEIKAEQVANNQEKTQFKSFAANAVLDGMLGKANLTSFFNPTIMGVNDKGQPIDRAGDVVTNIQKVTSASTYADKPYATGLTDNLSQVQSVIDKYDLPIYKNTEGIDRSTRGFTYNAVNAAINASTNGTSAPGRQSGMLTELMNFDKKVASGQQITEADIEALKFKGDSGNLKVVKGADGLFQIKYGLGQNGNIADYSLYFKEDGKGGYLPVSADRSTWNDPPDKKSGLLGGLLTLASIIPSPIQPFALGANAVYQATQGNYLSAILSAVGANAAFSGVDSTVLSDAKNLADQGLSLSQIADTISQTYGMNAAAGLTAAVTGTGASFANTIFDAATGTIRDLSGNTVANVADITSSLNNQIASGQISLTDAQKVISDSIGQVGSGAGSKYVQALIDAGMPVNQATGLMTGGVDLTQLSGFDATKYINTLVNAGVPIDKATGMMTGQGSITDYISGPGGGTTSGGEGTGGIGGGGTGGTGGGTDGTGGTGGGTDGTGGTGGGTGGTGGGTGGTSFDWGDPSTWDWGKIVGTGASLFGGYLNTEAAKEAAAEQARGQIEAAKIAAEAAKFRPVGVTTRFGSSSFQFDPVTGYLKSAGYALSPDVKAQQDRIMEMAPELLTQYEGAKEATKPMGDTAQRAMELGKSYLAKTPQEMAAQFMAEQKALYGAADERQLAGLQNKLVQQGRLGLATGGTSTGMMAANPELEAFYNAQRQRDLQLAAQSTQGGMDYAKFGAGLVGTGGDLLKSMYGTQTAAYQPYQQAIQGAQYLEGLGQNAMQQGISLGSTATAANAASGNLLAQGMLNAANTQGGVNQQAGSTWGNLLQGAGNAIQKYVQPTQQGYRYDPYTGRPII